MDLRSRDNRELIRNYISLKKAYRDESFDEDLGDENSYKPLIIFVK